MSQTVYTEEEVRELLRIEVERAGGQMYWGCQHGINQQEVSRALSGRSRIHKGIAGALGLRPLVSYVKDE